MCTMLYLMHLILIVLGIPVDIKKLMSILIYFVSVMQCVLKAHHVNSVITK